MSEPMAAILGDHYPAYKWDREYGGNFWVCTSLSCDFESTSFDAAVNHQAEQLAANGYGKLEDAKAQAWRDGYYTGKRDYAGSITSGLSISTPNPHEWSPE